MCRTRNMKGLLLIAASLAVLFSLGLSTPAAKRDCVDTDGRVYTNGACTEMVHNCTKVKVCRNGKLHTKDTQCTENAECIYDFKARLERCVCMEGFSNNGTEYCWKLSDLKTPPADGGCFFEGKVVPQGKFISEDCTKHHECKNGRMRSVYKSCSDFDHKRCKKDADGTRSCVCMDGFSLLQKTGQCYNEQHPIGDCTLPNGQKLALYQLIWTDNCTKKVVCWNGVIMSTADSCNATQRCGVDGRGQMRCLEKDSV